MQTVLALNAQHVAGATLFANRADALAALPRGGNIAEIGVAFGDFSQVLLEKLAPKHFDAYDIFRLHEVETIWGKPSADVFKGKSHRAYYEDRFHQEIASGQLRVFEGDSSAEMAQRDDEQYDVIYMDGDHSYKGVLRDAEVAARKIRHEGFLVFNDYTMADHLTMSPYGVVPVVNEFCVNRGWKVVYLAINSQMFCDICIKRRIPVDITSPPVQTCLLLRADRERVEMSKSVMRVSVFRPVTTIKDIMKKTVQRAARWLLWDRIWPMIEARVAPLEARVAPLEARVAPLEARVAPQEARAAPLEARAAPLEARVAPLEARVAPLEARVEQFETGWRQHLPAFLNAVSTVRSFGFELGTLKGSIEDRIAELRKQVDELAKNVHVFGESQHHSEKIMEEYRKSLDAIYKEFRNFVDTTKNDLSRQWNRIEFVRKEIFFELKYESNAATAKIPRAAERRVIAKGKFAEAQTGGLRINLGCGHIPLEGYINVDIRELPGVDVVADVGELPVEPGTVQEIFSAHLVEHFPQEMLRRRLLPYWKTLLASAGVFRAIVPDGETMLAGVADGTYPFEDFREVLFGTQEYHGDFHCNLLTPASFTGLLHETGFTDITVPAKGRRNGKCFEFEVCALRGPSTPQDLTVSPVNGNEQAENAAESEQKLSR